MSGFGRPREFTKPVGLKKKSTLEACFKNMRFRCTDSLVSCGQKVGSYKKSVQLQKYPDWCGRSLTQNLSYCNALFAALKQALGSRDTPGLPCNNPEELLLSLGDLCEDYMGGSSGVVSQY